MFGWSLRKKKLQGFEWRSKFRPRSPPFQYTKKILWWLKSCFHSHHPGCQSWWQRGWWSQIVNPIYVPCSHVPQSLGKEPSRGEDFLGHGQEGWRKFGACSLGLAPEHAVSLALSTEIADDAYEDTPAHWSHHRDLCNCYRVVSDKEPTCPIWPCWTHLAWALLF